MSDIDNIFDDIEDEYKINNFYNKEKLINKLPNNLKTKAKLKFLDTLGDNISEQEFVQLLKYQTQGADNININYLIKYHNTACDSNNMPIFNKDFTYRCLKPQALYTYIIINSFRSHPVFSSYNDKLIQFLEKKLERGVFASNENFRYDLKIRDVAIEFDEIQHNKPKKTRKKKNKQLIIDDEKDSLVKLHGKTLVRFVCDSVVNIKAIKADVYKNFEDNVDNVFSNLLDLMIDEIEKMDNKVTEINVSKKDILLVIDNKIKSFMRLTCGKKLTNSLKKNNIKFNEIFKDKAEEISNIIKNNVNIKVNIMIDNMAAICVKDSQYLKDKLYELHDIMLCSLLKDYDFRQEYINIVFKESMIDELEKKYKYIQILVNKNNNSNILQIKKDKFDELKLILSRFIIGSKEFDKLLKFKTRSFKNPNNPCVIKFNEIVELLYVEENKLDNFRELIDGVCDIDTELLNQDILLSWIDINEILQEFPDDLSLTSILLLYYMRIDKIYEDIIRRINAHNSRTNSTENDYYTYMVRIKKRNDISHTKAIERLERDKKISDDTVKAIDKVLDKKKIQEIELIKSVINIDYSMYDLEKLNRTNIQNRFDKICDDFTKLVIIENITNENNSSDTDESDVE